MKESQITVSIVCLVYNHELYLRKCLDSILNQNTNFNIEVIINDDASTDSSKEIILEYEKKYPNIIKPIFHEENQWSKGINILRSVLSITKGKYVAICDGDDYWLDSNKLQKQFEFMENHQDCSICSHKMLTINAKNNDQLCFIPPKDFEIKEIYTIKDFILKGYFIQTTSYFIRGTVVNEYCENLPKFVEICPAWDTALLMWCCYKGNIGFINEVMGVYRFAVNNSWVEQLKQNNNKRKQFHEKLILCYEEFDRLTNNVYHKEISHATNYLAVIGDCRDDLLTKDDFKRRKKYLKKEKIKYFIQTKFGFLRKIFKKRKLIDID